MKKILFITLVFGAATGFAAGDSLALKKKYCSPEIGIRPQIGFLMAHHSQMLYLEQGHLKLYEVYAEKLVDGKKNWHHAYQMPTVGVSLSLADMGNPTNMGYGFAGLIYLKYHLIRPKKFELNFRTGAGLAYLTKWFNRTDNNKNSAIAAPYNVCLSLSLEPQWRLKKFDLGAILSFTHFSNGAFKTPNLGFNFPAIGLQFGYRFNDQEAGCDKKNALKKFITHNTLEATVLAGEKEIMPTNGPKYFAGGLNLMFRRRYQAKSNLLVFSDLSYNAAYRKSYENWYNTKAQSRDSWRAGAGIGYGLSLDHFMLLVEMGRYFYDRLKYDGSFYHRIGARYMFDKGLIANLSLKTHFAKADVIELGLGYGIRLKSAAKASNHY